MFRLPCLQQCLDCRMPSQPVSESDLTELSIEDLMEQKVTSVSRIEQTFSDTTAAVFVITQDDLRRSGVTNIPEALRMVPGVQVAQDRLE